MTIIFLDLETTGLDPAKDRILELAAARVDAQLNPVDGFASVIRPSTPPIMDEYVTRMHTENGLLAALAEAPTLSDVNCAFCAWLEKQAPIEDRPNLTLAGNSVHFDLGFLRSWLPVAAKRFSHRLLDVSAIGVARQAVGMPKCEIVGSASHRAQSDVMASIGQARWYLSRMQP